MSQTAEVPFGSVTLKEVGSKVARYRLLRPIGQGGMANVYEAVREDIGLHVALKLLSPGVAGNPVYQQRFLREARALSRLDDPGLVRIIDFGAESADGAFLAMELLSGEPLSTRLESAPGRRLSVADTLRLGSQLASALWAAHARNVVHRDLKPENIMLIADSAAQGQQRAKLLDFGIAQLVDDTGRGDSVVIGTPSYMSPEQFRGDAVSASSDVYSLGILLFQTLSGQLPFCGTLDEIRSHHLNSEPPALHRLCLDAPLPLIELIRSMLDKTAQHRPSMMQVKQRLQEIQVNFSAPNERSLAHGERPAFMRSPRRVLQPVNVALALTSCALLAIAVRSFTRPTPPAMVAVSTPAPPAVPPAPEPLPTKIILDSEPVRPRVNLMIDVPGGRFKMGSTQKEVDAALATCEQISKKCKRESFDRELPQHRVTMSRFRIDFDLVNHSEYVDYLNHLGPRFKIERDDDPKKTIRWVSDDNVMIFDLYPSPNFGVVFADGRFKVKPGYESLPIQQVSWNGARRYCAFKGKTLPSEAQWEYMQRLRWPKKAAGLTPNLLPGITEWVLDSHSDRYPSCNGPCKDPVNGKDLDEKEGYRVLRGCARVETQIFCRPTARAFKRVEDPPIDVGFRCAAGL